MPFDGEYDFLEPIPSLDTGQDYCFSGRSKKTGDNVSIHLLAASREFDNYTLLAKLSKLSPFSRQMVRKAGVEAGIQYIISLPIPEHQPIREWLANAAIEEPAVHAGLPLSPLAQPEQKLSAVPPAVGEFTALFMLDKPLEIVSSNKADPISQPLKKPQIILSPQAPPGEFTQLMRQSTPNAAQLPTAPQPATPPAALQQAVLPQTKTPGEFTTLFPGINTNPKPKPNSAMVSEPLKQLNIPSPPQQPLPPKPAKPGEFTAMFEFGPPPPGMAPRQPAAPQSPPPTLAPVDTEATRLFAGTPPIAPKVERNEPDWTPPKPSQGEFTKMIQSPMVSSSTFGDSLDFKPAQRAPVSPPPAPKSEGEFTKMFGREEIAQVAPRPRSNAPVSTSAEATGMFTNSASPRVQPASGWSEEEFQQTFGPPPPPTPARVVVSNKQKTKLQLMIAMGVIFLLVVIVVLFFVLRR